jgi:hypothetical protein
VTGHLVQEPPNQAALDVRTTKTHRPQGNASSIEQRVEKVSCQSSRLGVLYNLLSESGCGKPPALHTLTYEI